MKDGFDALCAWPCESGTLLSELEDSPVGGWCHAGTHPASWSTTRALARQTGGALALGLHPWWAQDLDDEAMDRAIAELVQAEPAIVGEIGLDHMRAKSPQERARQRAAFEAQLRFAHHRALPIVVHSVRAIPETLRAISDVGLSERGGIIHGWTAGPSLATAAQGAGLHLSVGPLILRESGHKVRASVAAISRRRLVLESHGSPLILPQLAEAVAHIWGCTAVEVLRQTGYNARRVYGLLPPAPD